MTRQALAAVFLQAVAQTLMLASATYLLCASGNQRPIPRPDLLDRQPPALARPRALHLHEHPLVRPERPRIVAVDRMVQTDHHPELLPILALSVCRLAQRALQPPPQIGRL